MKTLAVDTALGACSVAITADGATRAHRWVAMPRGHAEALAPMVDEAMGEAGLAFADLDRLAVTTGPGTFTGQRVGLAFMRGLRIALGRPLVGLTTLEVMAAAAAEEAKTPWVAVLHEAKRGEVYGALYQGRETILPVQVASYEAFMEEILKVTEGLTPGDGLALAGTAAPEATAWLEDRGAAGIVLTAVRQPDALWLARLARTAVEPSEPVRPLYLRAPDAKLAASAIRLREANPGDAALLADLHRATMPRVWETGFFEEIVAGPGGFAVVAEANGAALGFALARVAADEAEILSIGVLTPYRQNGIGARLLREAAARAGALGAATLFLEVAEDNLSARRLYEAQGLGVVGTRKNYYGDEGGGDAILLRGALPLPDHGLGIDPKVA
jgi:tRNA threonylcarbamoyl adenosine modification protein YeaZ